MNKKTPCTKQSGKSLGGPGSFKLPGMSMKKLCNFKYALETKVHYPFG